MKIQVTKAQASRFLLKKQLLFPPQSLQGSESINSTNSSLQIACNTRLLDFALSTSAKSSMSGIETVFNRLRLIQYDPLNPCGRNVDLVLQSRIKDYHPDAYYTWLYKEKKGIECYDKELCIIPIEDFPWTNIRRVLAQTREDKKIFLQQYEKQITLLLKRIASEGPITSSDILDETRVESGWGTDAKFGRIALETLWKVGQLIIVKRENGKKYYDLPRMPHKSWPWETDANQSLTKEHIKRRLRSVGLLPLSGAGAGWQGLGSVRAMINQLVHENEFLEVNVTDSPDTYVIEKSDEQLIKEDSTVSIKKKLVFIAPLDNLMWDRQMILDLFNFHYRWEVYTPLAKREYGYYVLPILYGDTFIGRIEPVLMKDRTLVIKSFWQEDKRFWNKKVWNAFEEGLAKFKKYLHANEIVNAPCRETLFAKLS